MTIEEKTTQTIPLFVGTMESLIKFLQDRESQTFNSLFYIQNGKKK